MVTTEDVIIMLEMLSEASVNVFFDGGWSVDDLGKIIDPHCFEYSQDGIMYDGCLFPSETFSGKGHIGGIEISCINPSAQVHFHLGYEHDENDVHDVLLLCNTFRKIKLRHRKSWIYFRNLL